MPPMYALVDELLIKGRVMTPDYVISTATTRLSTWMMASMGAWIQWLNACSREIVAKLELDASQAA
jgi:hypothetical protein